MRGAAISLWVPCVCGLLALAGSCSDGDDADAPDGGSHGERDAAARDASTADATARDATATNEDAAASADASADAGPELASVVLALKGANANQVWVQPLSDGMPEGPSESLDTYPRARALAVAPDGREALVAFARTGESVEAAVSPYALHPALAAGDDLRLGATRAPTALAFMSATEAVVALRDSEGPPVLLAMSKTDDGVWTSGEESACDEAPVQLSRIADETLLVVQSVDGVRQVRLATLDAGAYVLGPVAKIPDGPPTTAVHPLQPAGVLAVPEPATAEEVNGQGLLHDFVVDDVTIALRSGPVTLDLRAVDLAMSPRGEHVAFTHEIRERPPGGVVDVVVGYEIGGRDLDPEGRVSDVSRPTIAVEAHDVAGYAFTSETTLAAVIVSRDDAGADVHRLAFYRMAEDGSFSQEGASIELPASPVDLVLAD